MNGVDFEGVVDLMMHGARDGLRDALELVRRESDRLVPVDEGDLRESSRVTLGQTEGVVSYGAPHARIVHEVTELHHPNGGQAKFLETALLSNGPRVLKAIANGIKQAVR